MLTLLVIVLVLGFLAAPSWNYSQNLGYGWYPSSGLGVVLLILLILFLTGHLGHR